MVFELKLRKIGESVGLVLPQEALAHLNAGDGDSVVLTEAPDGSFTLTPARGEQVTAQMKAAESIIQRYRNTLSELAK